MLQNVAKTAKSEGEANIIFFKIIDRLFISYNIELQDALATVSYTNKQLNLEDLNLAIVNLRS